ncbi:hypothetical protein PHPALM_28419 [Phytophthora palmivora]|uniref:Uncharacterized protein n=1 Tax=Phytophthora palmivora TaxID=4796 RepID=A0A2P4XA74_9STRA|nr:hypothetical protein PHPALM_28419 [Phytophthora palmivora]
MHDSRVLNFEEQILYPLKLFNLDGPDGFKYYWCDMRQPARLELAILRDRQNSGDYIYTMSEYMLPFPHRNYGIDFVYQQDNASIHALHEKMSFLLENNANTMVWPARPPDCNR